MRKMMTKEVTKTTVKIAKMGVVDGLPQATQLPDEILLGNVSLEKAQKSVTKKLGAGVSVFQVIPSTEIYELPVAEFIQIATIRTADNDETENDENDEAESIA